MSNLLKIAPKEFFTGGKCTVTIKSDAGEHKTFRIKHVEGRPKNPSNPDGPKWPESYFVSLLTGSENDSDGSYTSFGKLNPETGEVNLYNSSPYRDDTEAVRIIRFVLAHVWKGQELPPGIHIQTPSHCCRCNRMLTAPKEKNPYWPWFGPECGTK
jgi:hypothetical protein